MELIELSKKSLKEEDVKLYKKIIKDYNYDLVIFIAKGSFYIGKDLAEFNDANLLEIFAKRKGGKLKKVISPFLKIIPKKFKKFLRDKEFNSNYHEKNKDRNISFNVEQWKKCKKCEKILLVDDSVDTGYSIKFAKEAIEKFFTKSIVKVAAINYFTKSEKIVNVDYFLHKDTLLIGPWSNDSSENKLFLNEYFEWHERQEK